MCIRDSGDARQARVVCREVGIVVTVGLAVVPACLGVVRANPGPVSYTHLRAHETVLDLVCRLLLEKKNSGEGRPLGNS